jgi:hypothetical protein
MDPEMDVVKLADSAIRSQEFVRVAQNALQLLVERIPIALFNVTDQWFNRRFLHPRHCGQGQFHENESP